MGTRGAAHAVVDISGGALEHDLVVGTDGCPPLVFLHEGLGSIELWRGVPDEIAAQAGNPTTLVYARHGYGWSAPAVMPRPVGYMHHEADVVLPELLDRLSIDRPVLIGHSDGASIALLAAGAGLEVAGVVCIAPHVFVEPESIVGIEAARQAASTTDLVERLGRYHADPAATFFGWNDVWSSAGFRAWNIEDRLGDISAPVLAIQGDADDYGTFAQLDAIRAGCHGPVGQLRVGGAGHAPHLEARRLVGAAIAGFVRTLSVSRLAS